MDALGWIHTTFGLLALAFGASIVRHPKGTRRHRRFGWAYVASMLGLLGTAFLIYDLFGRFGIFHWLAVVSLATLAGGVAAARLRRRPHPTWMTRHYFLMGYSYVGLVAATAAEIAVRVPDVPFGGAALVASISIVVLGAGVIHWRARRIIAAVRQRREAPSAPAEPR